MSSFVTTTRGKQYLAISHIMTVQKNICRSSVLDLASLEYRVDFSYCADVGDAAETPFALAFEGYGMGATSEDNISQMYAYAKPNASYSFNISWASTSKALLNGGGGVIGFGPDSSNATEWAIPAGKTEGSLTLDGNTVEIDTKRSFTWYDRQISHGTPRNWTWFELSFPGTDIKASMWAQAIDPALEAYTFATVRVGESQLVLAYDLVPDYDNTWTSPNSGLTYALSWKLKFENGDYLRIESVKKDQEMYGYKDPLDSAYEGFITASGSFFGQKQGYGVVEMVTIYE